MEDVKLKLTPEVDTSKVKKDMDQIAKDSKTAITKSMNDLAQGMSRAMKMAKEDVNTIGQSGKISDMFKRAADAVQLFNERTKNMHDMKDIDAETLKLFSLESKLKSTAQSILRLQSDWEKLINTVDASNAIDAAYGSIDKAKERIEELRQVMTKLQSEVSGRPFTPEIFSNINEQMREIDKERQHLKELYAERKQLESSPTKGSDEWTQRMELLNELIPMVTQKLATMSNSFYAMGKKEGFGKTKEEVTETLNKMNQLLDATREFQAATQAVQAASNEKIWRRDTLSRLAPDINKFEKILNKIREISGEADNAAEHVEKIGKSSEQAAFSMSNMRNAVWSVSRLLGSVYTIGLDFARTAKQIAHIYKTIWDYGKKLLSVFKKLKDTIRSTAKDHAKSWKQMLRDVFRYAFGIRSLFALFRRLRRYIKEAFEEMAKQIPEVNNTLSELKSSLGMLKGSLATAFEPILSFIAPALNLLIEKLATAMTYIGMFFAALTGRGYVYKATKTVQTFADSVKELNKQLQGFDEINNLTTNKDNGANDTPMAKFEKVPVPDWIQKIADYLKDLLHKFIDPIKKAWARIGPYVVAAWKRAFYNVKALLMDIVDDFMKAWSEKGQDIAEHFLEITGDVGNIIANISEALRTAWNYEDNGYKIWKAILEIIDKILVGVRKITIDMVQWTHNINLTPAMTAFREWLESLVPITEMVMNILYDFWHDALKPILTWAFDGENSGIARLFRIFKDFNDKLDTEKIRENLDKVWQALGRFGQTVGEGLLIFLDRMSTRIADFANGDKFESICDKIVAFLDEIKPEDVADDLEQLVDTVGNLAKQVWDAIKFVLDHKDEILDMIEWISEHLKGIIALMVSFKTVIDFARLAANIYLMVTAFQKLQGAGGIAGLITKLKSGGGFISKIIGLLGGLSSTVWIVIGVVGALIALFVVLYNKSEDFRAGVDKGLQTIKDAFSNFMEHLRPSLEVLKEAFAPVLDVIKAIGAYLIEHLPQILGFIGEIVGGVISLVGYAIRFIGDAINVIVSFITGILALLMGDIDGFFKSGDNMIRSFIDGVLSFLSFALGVDLTGLVDDTISAISEAFQKMGDGIKDVFRRVKETIYNIVNSIKQWFINLINWIVEKINWAANKLNELKNSKGLSTVISLAGGSPALNAIQQTSQTRSAVRSIPNSIPGLANGAVIPPNNEFLALLGDQKHGTNIETPLDTMIEAFNMAGGNTSQEELQLMREQNELLRGILENCGITDKQIFRSVQRSVVDYQKQTGKTAFA